MSFTVRKLSESATSQLKKLQKNDLINTNTRAIEHALEEHHKIELNESEMKKWRWKSVELENELEEIKDALKIVKNFIQ